MTEPAPLDPVTLTGRLVRLELLTVAHHDELCDAVRDGELWRLWYTAIPRPEGRLFTVEGVGVGF
jgi:hypothetical protein